MRTFIFYRLYSYYIDACNYERIDVRLDEENKIVLQHQCAGVGTKREFTVELLEKIYDVVEKEFNKQPC